MGGELPRAVRFTAIESLGDLGEVSALETLGREVDSDDEAHRQRAIVSIGRLGDPRGFEILGEALQSGPPDVRFQAARSIVEIDPEKAATPLLTALENEADPEVVGAIALGLAEIGDPTCADRIAANLDSSRPETGFECAYALAILGDRRGVAILAAAASDPHHSWDAIEALESAKGDDSSKALADLLTTTGLAPEIPIRAAGALLQIDPESDHAETARKTLLGNLSAWKHHLRGLAVAELARVGGAWAFAELNRLRGRRRGAVLREEIDEALAEITSRTEAVTDE